MDDHYGLYPLFVLKASNVTEICTFTPGSRGVTSMSHFGIVKSNLVSTSYYLYCTLSAYSSNVLLIVYVNCYCYCKGLLIQMHTEVTVELITGLQLVNG